MGVAIGDGDLANLLVLNLVQELGEADLFFPGSIAGTDDGKQQYRQTDQNYPKN